MRGLEILVSVERVAQRIIMRVNLPITVFVVFTVFCFVVNDVQAHMHNMMKYASAMSPDMKFQLQWAYNDTGMLYFKMKCQGTGWCGVGFADSTVNSDGKNMASYDIAIGGYSSTGYLDDYWSDGRGRPAVDTEQSLTLIDANETNGYTMVDFMRPADTMQPQQDLAIMNDTEVWIMYGAGPTDVTDTSTFDKHANDARQVLSMKYNLIAMAMAAAAEPTTAMGTMSMTSSVSATESTMTESTPTTASATKCGGSHAVVPVIFVLIARFVFSS
ncbi:DBH-like monooxygenase protein 2 homolog isoform X2 [Acropora muricata]|uniref:DBH-like monooxygenase protein 2 homolog isoform X2 n=1 Tax=Acropora muricata TaxID=159855 RepID=UPI0034E48B1A